MLRRLRRGEEAGFTLIEVVAAMSILAVGFLTLTTAATTGLRLVVQGRQRQVATEAVNARLEHLRNIPYVQVALSSQPSHSTDADNPDFDVNTAGTGYDYEGGGTTYETLIVDTADGQVIHIEDPVVVGSTELIVYQYVTWVDDSGVVGTQDYKRVTIVATFKTAGTSGRPKTVQVSALLTSGSVSVSGTTPGASQGSSSTPSPSPSPTPSGTCSGDIAGPTGSFSILSGTGAAEGFTASTSVTISMAPSDACTPITVQFSNDNVTYGSTITYDSTNPTATWTVTTGDGAKSVWAKFKDGIGNERVVGPESITLDTTRPSVPSTLTYTASCQGVDRTVNLAWGTSTDTNFLGYRVYRSIDDGAFESLVTSSTQSASDTHNKTLDSVRYKVVGYDKAGNESLFTNEVSLAKNQCS